MYKHSTAKPWKCDECDYAHAAKAGLVEHKKYFHGKESDMNTCHLCPYKTPGKSELKKHIEMVHQKIKRFTCDQCARQFYQNNQLKRHIRGTLLYFICMVFEVLTDIYLPTSHQKNLKSFFCP